MSKKLMLLSLLIILNLNEAFAIQEFETVVTDTKFNSSSKIVIDKEEIEKSRARDLTSLLAAQANISIAQSNFTPTSIYLRGGDSSNILILVDGVPTYDASTVQNTINLNSLNIKSVQRIEIIKGSQAVFYGGQALSGIIKIDTIPNEFKSSGQVMAQLGTQHQSSISAGVLQPLVDQSAVMVRGSYAQKDNASPVLDSTKTYPTHLGTAELAYVDRNHPVEFLFKGQTSFDKTFIATTAFPAYSAADTDNFETSTYQMINTLIFKIPKSNFKPEFIFATQQNARQFTQNDNSGGGLTNYDYKGSLLALRYEMIPLQIDKIFNLKVGANYNQDKMIFKNNDVTQSDELAEFEGFFAKADSMIINKLQIEGGVRLDYIKMKNQIATYQLGLTIDEFIKIEQSTAFKQPSLFQLYGNYGNQDLKPEKAISFSVTLEGNLNSDLYSSVTVFENQFENLILISGTPQKYENVAKSKTQGLETSLGYRVQQQGLQYNLAIGYQEPKDVDGDNWLVRRPLRTGSFKVRKEFGIYSLTTEIIHNGDRRDRTGATSYGTLNSYTLVNVVAEAKPFDNLAVFSRIQNLANQRYESSYGFYDEGLNASAGVEFSF